MFSLISGFWNYLFNKPNLHVLIIGLDHAGKTTLLEKIKSVFGNQVGIPPEKIPPTIGMNLAKIKFKGSQVVFWDLGGQLKMRSMWEKYYSEANSVIFVVDSVDLGRLDEAKLAYDSACNHDGLTQVPVFTFANKQDLSGSLTVNDIAMKFHPVRDAAEIARVFPISAITELGIKEAVSAVILEAQKNAFLRE